MKIADSSGRWFINTAQYPFHDPDSNTRFEPGEPTQAKHTAWIDLQEVIRELVDPNNPGEFLPKTVANPSATAEAAANLAAAAAKDKAGDAPGDAPGEGDTDTKADTGSKKK